VKGIAFVGAVGDREQRIALSYFHHGIRDLKIAPTTTHQSVIVGAQFIARMKRCYKAMQLAII